MKKVITITLALLVMAINLHAQCAMCRTQLENNFSNGDPGIAAGINTGILYLLVMPYLAVMVIAYLWFKSSKHGQKNLPHGADAR